MPPGSGGGVFNASSLTSSGFAVVPAVACARALCSLDGDAVEVDVFPGHNEYAITPATARPSRMSSHARGR